MAVSIIQFARFVGVGAVVKIRAVGVDCLFLGGRKRLLRVWLDRAVFLFLKIFGIHTIIYIFKVLHHTFSEQSDVGEVS